MRRSPAVRLAVAWDRIVAMLADGEVRMLPIGPEPGSVAEGAREASAQAADAAADTFAAFLRDLPSGRVAWTLLPPLVDVRPVQLPRLRPEETTTALERHAGRYFPAARDAQVVAWRVVDRPRGAPVRLVAAAASEPRLGSLATALREVGLEPGDPVPATEAWVAAAVAARPGFNDGAVALADEDRTVLLAVRGGCATDVAVLPGGAVERVIDRLRQMAAGGDLVVLGGGDVRAALDAALAGQAGQYDAVEVVSGPREDATVLAARHAHAGGLALVAPEQRAGRRNRERRLARAFSALAAVLIAAAGALELWGVNHELAAVRDGRAALAGAVSEAMNERQELDALRDAIARIDSLERTTPAWAGLVAELADHLPDGAYLSGFRGEPDSLAIEGVARDAAGAFAALRHVDGVREVRVRSPIRREQQPGGAVEHFSLAARLVDSSGRPGGAGGQP